MEIKNIKDFGCVTCGDKAVIELQLNPLKSVYFCENSFMVLKQIVNKFNKDD